MYNFFSYLILVNDIEKKKNKNVLQFFSCIENSNYSNVFSCLCYHHFVPFRARLFLCIYSHLNLFKAKSTMEKKIFNKRSTLKSQSYTYTSLRHTNNTCFFINWHFLKEIIRIIKKIKNYQYPTPPEHFCTSIISSLIMHSFASIFPRFLLLVY